METENFYQDLINKVKNYNCIEQTNLIENIKSKLKLQDTSNLKGKIIFASHLGLGDHFTQNGLIRYLSLLHEEVKICCYQKNLENLKLIYQEDKNITFYIFENYNDFLNRKHEIQKMEDYTLISAGVCKGSNNFSNIPFNFYEDVEVPYQVFWDFFYIPTTKESLELYNQLEKNNISEYILVHNSTSETNLFSVDQLLKNKQIDKNKTLIININKNEYQPGHYFYEVAQNFIFQPMINYKRLAEKAKAIYCTGSSFFCMVSNLHLDSDECYLIYNLDLEHWYSNPKYGFNKTNKKKFKKLVL